MKRLEGNTTVSEEGSPKDAKCAAGDRALTYVAVLNVEP